jgi:hypothetical protein
VVCDENGIGGDCRYCGDNDEQLDCINVFYHGDSGGKYVPRALLFGLGPGVIGAAALSRRSASSSAGKLVEPYALARTGPTASTKGLRTSTSYSLL